MSRQTTIAPTISTDLIGRRTADVDSATGSVNYNIFASRPGLPAGPPASRAPAILVAEAAGFHLQETGGGCAVMEKSASVGSGMVWISDDDGSPPETLEQSVLVGVYEDFDSPIAMVKFPSVVEALKAMGVGDAASPVPTDRHVPVADPSSPAARAAAARGFFMEGDSGHALRAEGDRAGYVRIFRPGQPQPPRELDEPVFVDFSDDAGNVVVNLRFPDIRAALAAISID